jgi:metal-sulfur cluster biosynthetic enzyme
MNPNLEDQVRQALSGVIDPETGLNVMRMGIIHDLACRDDGRVSLVFRPSAPVCPMAYSLANSIKKSVEAVDKVNAVDIKVENFHEASRLEALLKSSTSDSR